MKILIFPKSRAGKNTRKMPLLRNRGAERRVYENRAYEAGKDHRYFESIVPEAKNMTDEEATALLRLALTSEPVREYLKKRAESRKSE